MPCSLTCLLTSSRLSATPLSALLLLASFWHFPLLHNRCLMTWERPAGGRLGGLEPPTLCGPAPPRPPYLVGIVKEFQHCEDAGPDEQAHLAPDVSCGFRLERLAGSGRRGRGGDEAQQDGGGGGARQPCLQRLAPWYTRVRKPESGRIFSLCFSVSSYFSKMSSYYSGGGGEATMNSLQNAPLA